MTPLASDLLCALNTLSRAKTRRYPQTDKIFPLNQAHLTSPLQPLSPQPFDLHPFPYTPWGCDRVGPPHPSRPFGGATEWVHPTHPDPLGVQQSGSTPPIQTLWGCNRVGPPHTSRPFGGVTGWGGVRPNPKGVVRKNAFPPDPPCVSTREGAGGVRSDLASLGLVEQITQKVVGRRHQNI
jgi:hypothetical protein